MKTRESTPRWLLWSVASLGFVLLALCCGPWAARGQGDSCAYVHPSDQEVLVGRPGSFQVRVDNIEDLYGVQVTLVYDPAIIDVTGVYTAGNVFDGMSGTGWTNIDEVAGTIEHVFTLDSSEPAGYTGSGPLFEVQFTTIQHGVTAIEFAEIILANSSSASISLDCPPSARNGRVRAVLLLSTATTTPTRSLTPTSTATSCCPGSATPSPTASPTRPPLAVTPVVYIHPETHNVLIGHSSAVDIRIANASTLYGAWVQLLYDPTVIEILDIGLAGPLEDGDLFDPKDWYPFVPAAQQVVGNRITYGATLSFAASEGATGEVLARVHFRALDIGVTPLTFESVLLTNKQGASLPYASQDGAVQVINIMPESPTVTPTPEQSATPSPTPTDTPAPVPTALLYLAPEASNLAIGDVATIEVGVADVTDLWGVQFHIGFDPSLIAIVDENPGLPGTQIAYGPLLSPGSVTQNIVDDAGGVIHMAYTQVNPTAPKSGSGVVARFQVQALAGGATSLAMHGTQLLNSSLNSIAHGAIGGFVAIDARVISGSILLEGRTNHSGTVIKDGGVPLATSQSDGGFMFIAPGGVGSSLQLNASHQGYLTAARTLVVTDDPVVDAGDCTLVGGDVAGPRITVSRAAGCPGDATVDVPGLPDGRINVIDLTFVAGHFGITAGDLTWQPSADGCHPEWLAYRADINGDGEVNILDVVRVSNNFGQSGPTAW